MGAETAETVQQRSGAKHRELTEALQTMVAEMRPGDKLPTQAALMRRFQVSDTTVLRALDELKRAGWIVRRQGSGTFVADRQGTPAVPPARPRTGLVAVMTRPSRMTVLSELVEAVEANLFTQELAPVLIVDGDAERRVERARAHWNNGDVIGAIHVGSAPLEGLGDMPTILIGETEAEDKDFCQVSLDNRGAGQQVGEFLWGLGHRGVAAVGIGSTDFLQTPQREGVDRLRVLGLQSLWQKRGGAWHDAWVIAHPYLLRLGDKRPVEVMQTYLEPIFQGPTPPTALFAVHDEMATVAILALENMGLKVPDDVSIVGFNDTGSLAAYFRPSLTTVRTPSATLGTVGVHMFQELLRHPDSKPRSVRFPAEIIVRDSTGPVKR